MESCLETESLVGLSLQNPACFISESCAHEWPWFPLTMPLSLTSFDSNQGVASFFLFFLFFFFKPAVLVGKTGFNRPSQCLLSLGFCGRGQSAWWPRF